MGIAKFTIMYQLLWNKDQNRDEGLLKLQPTSVAQEFEMLCGTRHDHYEVDL